MRGKYLNTSLMALGFALAPTLVSAHFILVSPPASLVQDQRGDPQKAAPCGGTNANFGTPTYAVTEARGGSQIHIKVEETIYHPGFYRVALAVNSQTELPIDPKAVTMRNERGIVMSVSGAIMNPVAPPVLADGLFEHRAKPSGPFETDITLPNIDCKSCTLQVLQFMEDHAVNNPGEFSYHHCATLKITADPAKPRSAGWPAERQ